MRGFCVGCLLLLLHITSSLVWAQEDFAVSRIPVHLRTRANAVMRDRQCVVDMQSPHEVLYRVRQALTIMNPSVLEYARLALFYDKNTTIKSAHGFLYDGDGHLLKKIGIKDFLDESAVSSFSLYEDDRVKHFLPNALQYPFTVVYEYEIRYKQNLVVPDWRPKPYLDMAVEQSSYQFICGTQAPILIKEANYDGVREETQQEKQKSYIWRVEALPAVKIEPMLPPAESYQICVKIAPEQFFYYKRKGSYRDWKELGQWVYHDLIKDQQVTTPTMVSKVNALVSDIEDDKEKVKVLYQYLQEKTRYISVQIGIGGFQPMAASEVERLGYGDCKALVNYMQTLLNIAKIPSYYCVVNAGNIKSDMDADFASMAQGNHIILAVPLAKDTVWLECTSQKIPFNYLGDFTDDRTVLACTADGGKLLRTPHYADHDNLQQRVADFSLNLEGDIIGKLTTTFEGVQFENRLGILELPVAEQQKKLKQVYAVDNVDFTSIAYNTVRLDSTPQIDERLGVAIKRYAPKNGERVYLQPNIFNRGRSVPTLQERKMPTYINRGFVDDDVITYTLPDHYTMELKPRDLQLRTPFGEFTMEVKLADNKLIYHRKLWMKEGTFPPDQYVDYARFVNAVYSADLAKVVFLAD